MGRHREKKILKKIYTATTGTGCGRDIWSKPETEYTENSFVFIPNVCEKFS